MPTQNRLNTLIIELIVNAADDESVLSISITDFNEETVLASNNIGITSSLDGENMIYVDFWRNGQPYNVPLTPGETYKIKLTSSTGTGNVRWAFKANPNCVVGGVAIKGGIMDLDKDFGFTTRGYTYVAPVVAPVVTPAAETPTTAPATTTNSTSNTTAEPSGQTTKTNAESAGLLYDKILETNEADSVENNSNVFWLALAGGLILLTGILVFLQMKFRILTKIFNKKKKKNRKK